MSGADLAAIEARTWTARRSIVSGPDGYTVALAADNAAELIVAAHNAEVSRLGQQLREAEQRADRQDGWRLHWEGKAVEIAAECRAALALVGQLQGQLDAVRALHPRDETATSMHFHCDPHDCDQAGDGELIPWCHMCGEDWPCATVRALPAAVPSDQEAS